MLPKVGDDVKAVLGDFNIDEVNEKGDYDVHELEALYQVVLVDLYEGEVAHNEHNALEVANELKLTNLLVQDGDQLLSLLPELVKGVLLFQDPGFSLSATSSLNGCKSTGGHLFSRVLQLSHGFLIVFGFALADLAREHPKLPVV